MALLLPRVAAPTAAQQYDRLRASEHRSL